MSIIKPTPSQMTRRLIVLTTVIFSILIAYSQVFMGWGQSQAEFAAQGDQTLRVAGYAFSIWGMIYIGLLAYAVRQALPQTGESELITRFGWPSVVAFLAIGWWIVAAAFDWRWITVVLIWVALLALAAPFVGSARAIRTLPLMHRDRTLLVWPLAALGGWLTAAAPLNVVSVLTSEGVIPGDLPASLWAIIAIVGIAAIGIAMAWRLRTLAWPLPVAWALLGAFVAEQADGHGLAAGTALIAAIAVLGLSALIVFQLRPGIERTA